MSEQKKKHTKQQEKSNRVKEIWLAGLGALSAVEEEGSKLFRNLVDRGTDFEKKRKDQINEMLDEVSDRYQEVEGLVGDSFDKVEEKVEKNIRSIVSGMGIPTRKEVKELSDKIDRLHAKIEKLNIDKPAEPHAKKRGTSPSSVKP